MKKIAPVALIIGLAAAPGAFAATCDGACAVSASQIASAQYYASVTQSGGTAADGSGSNVATLTQSGGGFQSAKLDQTFFGSGKSNSADITQSGATKDKFEGFQLGAGNQMTVVQSASTGLDQASITQIGAMNVTSVSQNASMLGGGNTASVYQLGAANNVTLAQNGVGDTAVAKQFGSNDALSITQDGDNDYASYTQKGDNLNSAKNVIIQTGNGASVAVTQTPAGIVSH